MCHLTCLKFGETNLKENQIKNKKVLEIGSLNINGSLKEHIIKFKPFKYTGVDIQKGKNVDIVCNAENLLNYFTKESIDLLVATELLEHVTNWKKVITNFKQVLKKDGIILITTRSKGCKYHGYPYDFWRFELHDIKEIFSDFNFLVLEKDPSPIKGIFLMVKKPLHYQEKKIEDLKMFSIIKNKRILSINKIDQLMFVFLYKTQKISRKILPKKVKKFIKKFVKVNDQL